MSGILAIKVNYLSRSSSIRSRREFRYALVIPGGADSGNRVISRRDIEISIKFGS